MVEIRVVSEDDLLVEEFRKDAQNLPRIAKFFEQVAQKLLTNDDKRMIKQLIPLK